jgi:hypothetical protein
MAIVDVLTGCSGVEREIVAAAEIREALPKVFIPVARPGHLVALKVLAGRPQDQEDVRILLREIDPRALQSARQTLMLIEERGFNEEKDLLAEFLEIPSRDVRKIAADLAVGGVLSEVDAERLAVNPQDQRSRNSRPK